MCGKTPEEVKVDIDLLKDKQIEEVLRVLAEIQKTEKIISKKRLREDANIDSAFFEKIIELLSTRDIIIDCGDSVYMTDYFWSVLKAVSFLCHERKSQQSLAAVNN